MSEPATDQPATQILRCNPRFLRRLLIHRVFMSFSVSMLAWRAGWPIVCALFALNLTATVFVYRRSSDYRFTIDQHAIRTEKKFTRHADVTTPITSIRYVSWHGSIFENSFGLGTVEISVNVSNTKRDTLVWPHLDNPKAVVARLKAAQSMTNQTALR
jgi:membrane protein YdbS with pleckstrin-like domain